MSVADELKDEITADQNVPCCIKLELEEPVGTDRQVGVQVERKMTGKEIQE